MIVVARPKTIRPASYLIFLSARVLKVIPSMTPSALCKRVGPRNRMSPNSKREAVPVRLPASTRKRIFSIAAKPRNPTIKKII